MNDQVGIGDWLFFIWLVEMKMKVQIFWTNHGSKAKPKHSRISLDTLLKTVESRSTLDVQRKIIFFFVH